MRALLAALLFAAIPTSAFAVVYPTPMIAGFFAQVAFGLLGIAYFLTSVFNVIHWWVERKKNPSRASLENAAFFFLGGCCLYSGTFMNGLIGSYSVYPDTITPAAIIFIAIVIAVPFAGLILPLWRIRQRKAKP